MIVQTRRLGVQTNAGDTENRAIKTCKAWAPKRAKSFSMAITHTDYRGTPTDNETGYATVRVTYFSGPHDGEHRCNEEFLSKETHD